MLTEDELTITESILTQNTEFRWNASPSTFGGMSKDDLLNLERSAARFFGITPDMVSRVKFIWGIMSKFSLRMVSTLTVQCV